MPTARQYVSTLSFQITPPFIASNDAFIFVRRVDFVLALPVTWDVRKLAGLVGYTHR